jgi:hypothetical protein
LSAWCRHDPRQDVARLRGDGAIQEEGNYRSAFFTCFNSYKLISFLLESLALPRMFTRTPAILHEVKTHWESKGPFKGGTKKSHGRTMVTSIVPGVRGDVVGTRKSQIIRKIPESFLFKLVISPNNKT